MEEETDMKIDGGCHCGNITYRAEIEPENVGYATVQIARPYRGLLFAPVCAQLRKRFI